MIYEIDLLFHILDTFLWKILKYIGLNVIMLLLFFGYFMICLF